jgi:hypothetical protein
MAPKPPIYSTKSSDDGWLILEREQPIAFTDVEAFARAICQALNLQRAMVITKPLRVTPPTGHYLN